MAGPSEEEIAQLWAIHNSPERKRELLMRSYGFDTTRTWVDPAGYRLSDRVWRARQAVRDQIDQVLREAIANGTDALEVADILEQYLNPQLAPVRNALGRLIRNQKPVIVTRSPGRGGMGSFAARRLARTEITRAHGQATIETAKRTPFAVGVKWNLSGSHPRSDICDQHSRADDYDLGPGVYPPDKVPQYPSHPHDLCNLSTATDDDVDGVVARLREQYGLETAEEPTAESVAQRLVDQATSAEPRVTADLKALQPTIQGELVGLSHRLKTAESTARKLAKDAVEANISVTKAGAGLNDILRYTYVVDGRNYAQGILRTTDELRAKGYTAVKAKNFWDKSGYTGVHTIFRSPDGQHFELQFHTAVSIDVKENVSHPLYEQWRLLDKDSPEAKRLDQAIADAWLGVRAKPPQLDGLTDGLRSRFDST